MLKIKTYIKNRINKFSNLNWTKLASIATVAGFALTFYLTFNNKDSNQIDAQTDSIKKEIYFNNRFDEGPVGANGFMSINRTGIADGANNLNEISYLELNEEREFTIYINFRNANPETINNAQCELNFKKFGTSTMTTLNGYLFADNTNEIEDIVHLVDLPKTGWNLRFLSGVVYVDDRINKNGVLCSEAFPEIEIPRSKNIDNYDLINIGDLTYGIHKGWCEQGYISLKFTIDIDA